MSPGRAQCSLLGRIYKLCIRAPRSSYHILSTRTLDTTSSSTLFPDHVSVSQPPSSIKAIHSCPPLHHTPETSSVKPICLFSHQGNIDLHPIHLQEDSNQTAPSYCNTRTTPNPQHLQRTCLYIRHRSPSRSRSPLRLLRLHPKLGKHLHRAHPHALLLNYMPSPPIPQSVPVLAPHPNSPHS